MRGYLLPCLAAFLSTPALAGEVQSARSIDIAVSGTIAAQCSIGAVADMDFGDLERRGLGIRTPVAFSCNLPFSMTIKSANGALTHASMPRGQGPYGGQLPYILGVQMPIRHPAVQMVSRTFDSRQLLSGGVISSNGGIATDNMLLSIELGTPSGEAGLLAGEYSETITITVNPI
jgi:spore coat protein U-like protein